MSVNTGQLRSPCEYEKLFELLVDRSPDAIVRHDLNLRCTYANSTVLNVSGQPLETVIGALPEELPFVFDVQVYTEHLRNVIQQGEPCALELSWCTPEGGERWIQVRLVPERDASGQVTGILSVSHDITALKELQAKLVKAEAVAKIGFWELNSAHSRARISDHACHLMGKPAGWSPSRKELLAIHTASERAEIEALYHAAIAQGQPHLKYNYVTELNGEARHFHCQVELAYAHKGKSVSLFAVIQDITEQVRAEQSLRAHEQEFRVLVENTPDLVVRFDRECRRLYVNKALIDVTGLSREQLLGNVPVEQPATPEAVEYESILRLALATGRSQEYIYRAKDHAGRDLAWDMRVVAERDNTGEVISVLSIGRDMSAFEAAEERLREAQRIARICHWEWDYVKNCSTISRVGLDALGFENCSAMELADFQALIPEDDRLVMRELYKNAFAEKLGELSYEHGLMLPDGSRRETHNWVRLEYGVNGRAVRAIGVTQDVTNIKSLQKQTHQLEFYDSLTQLPNRALLNDRLTLSLNDSARQGASVGLVLLDIDHFQKVNDSLGSGAGDVLLQTVAGRLAQALREYDTVARLGGDEFAIIVPQIRLPSDLDVVAARIKKVFEKSISLQDTEIFVTASAGIAVFPADGGDADELLAHADAAMHHAKHCGRDNFQFYSAELTATALERLKVEGDLRKAIERHELELFYQPKVELTTGKVVGAEALMRWRHPERGLVPPDRFIGIAEDTGLIIDMGEWALRSACAKARQWNESQSEILKLAVNLSPRQFYTGDLLATITRALADTGCRPEWIELEITESLLLNDRVDIRTMLEKLHAMGCSIAIDDFGTGYSALSYLTRFPIDTLKIDRSFIRELTSDRDSAVLAKAIVTLGQSLRMEVVAEGVETASQRDHLAEWGCQMVQGFFYSKPVPWADFVTLMSQWSHHQ
ncbi:MAG: EAL domain-containing protein [Pseudomonadota bacterium]